MRKKFVVIFISVILLFVLSGCDSGSSTYSTEPRSVNTMNISNADSMFIAKLSSVVNVQSLNSASSDSETEKLFKITADGYIEEVKYYSVDEQGNKTEQTITKTPVAVYNTDSEYVFVNFGHDDYNIESGYLVKKDSGSVYDLSNVGYPIQTINGFANDNVIKSDSKGNFYYLSNISSGYSGSVIDGVKKLDINNLTGETITPSHHAIDYFTVDKNGNIAYHGQDDKTREYIERLKKANDSMDFLESKHFWTGTNNDIYYSIEEENLNAYSYGIKNISIDNSFNTEVNDYATNLENMDLRITGTYKLEFNDKIFLTDMFDPEVYEVENPDNSPRIVDSVGSAISDKITLAAASPNYYYIYSAAGELIRVNPYDDNVTQLLDGEYDVYKMVVSDDDVITFNGLRMSDSHVVISQINSQGNIKIISDTLDGEVKELIQIQ